MIYSRSLLYEKLTILACLLCNLSQIPALIGNGVLSLAYTLCWVLLAGMLALSRLKVNMIIFVLPIYFDVYCLLLSIFGNGNLYMQSNLFTPINMSAFILLIGYWLGPYVGIGRFKKISGVFVISSLLVALYIFFDVFKGVDWAGTGGYLYASKNSAGQIFMTAIILIVFLHLKEHKILWSVAIGIFVCLIVMMKSRATLLTLIIFVMYFIMFVVRRPSYKICLLAVIGVGIVIIFTNDHLHELYINQILLNNKDATDISAVTSNRDLQWQVFVQNFQYYALTGTGGTYLEAMPLSVLMSYGLLGGIPVLMFSLYPLYVGIRCVKNTEYRLMCTLIIAMGIMMWINGVFEEQSPFGPGVKCYFLWLTTGIFLGRKRVNECYERIRGNES